jgi:hypothetical protein
MKRVTEQHQRVALADVFCDNVLISSPQMEFDSQLPLVIEASECLFG